MKITPIRLIRLNAGIELEEAVEKLGVSRSTVYKVEQGHLKPSRDLIIKMRKVYKCSADEIFRALKM